MNPIAWPDPQRQQDFQAWLQPLVQPFNLLPESLHEAVADASTRRYLRIANGSGGSYIVMDAPPASNNVQPFIEVAEHMRGCGLHIPSIFAADEGQGFLLLSDLGSLPYLKALLQTQTQDDKTEANRLMRDATQALLKWQSRGEAERLPLFDEAFVLRELHIFKEWCVEREYGRQWDETQLKWWAHSCKLLAENIAAQPFVPMHRDFMVRNLMVCPPEDGNPGVLDFQDAVKGPISYDFASLLRDAFISWDEEQELDWAIRYWEQARKLGLPISADFGEFWQQLEWTGLQRHLKILGIFCRLKHRDGKPHHFQDLPRLFAYAIKVTTRYVQLSPLTRLLQELQGSMVETSFTLR
ncbi:aminoglycoside/choline kinase family phosphotransferase [Paucibacter oligotrophus]|uniref:Aminoglycoside/choline kinase family phosphotransferase n=1 Tax=Roseateles oligotrophus TaxID=1769250 RepID=A0A840L828_9BURK|nr:phosphotransferase [Roseateles oligotrophus]MBB4842822.1 aminoglycoside/choline kinase family phosphotransferase [Roseateles oligotrophus]